MALYKNCISDLSCNKLSAAKQIVFEQMDEGFRASASDFLSLISLCVSYVLSRTKSVEMWIGVCVCVCVCVCGCV